MTDMSSQVKIENDLTDTIVVTEGLKQGDRLAIRLCDLSLEYVIREVNIDKRNTVDYKSSQIMAYSGDMFVIHRYIASATEICSDVV
jgi:hypothetical protein